MKVQYLPLQASSDAKSSENMAEQTTRASGFKYHSPKDIHINNIIQIEHIYAFCNMYVYISMYIVIIKIKRYTEFE